MKWLENPFAGIRRRGKERKRKKKVVRYITLSMVVLARGAIVFWIKSKKLQLSAYRGYRSKRISKRERKKRKTWPSSRFQSPHGHELRKVLGRPNVDKMGIYVKEHKKAGPAWGSSCEKDTCRSSSKKIKSHHFITIQFTAERVPQPVSMVYLYLRFFPKR